jgi:hypothetical protein
MQRFLVVTAQEVEAQALPEAVEIHRSDSLAPRQNPGHPMTR